MPSHPKGPMGLSYSEPIQFDAQGRATVDKTVPSIGIMVNIRGWIEGPEAVYDILLESPGRHEWRGIGPEQEIAREIRLSWGGTKIKAVIVSSKPNTGATFHLTA